MIEKILVAVDESQQSTGALKWAARNLARPDVVIHLVTVLPPIVYSVYPVAPFATAAAVSAVTHHWEAQKHHDETIAKQTLQSALAVVTVEAPQIPRENVILQALPAAGGASGVAESIVEYAQSKDITMAVVGSRGMGAVKRSLMSIIGLGSVSDYCAHNMHCPTLIVHQGEALNPEQLTVSKFCVACDDSAHAELALTWAVRHMKPEDELHLITVALPVPYPVVVDDAYLATAAVYAGQEREAAVQQREQEAREVARRAILTAMEAGIEEERIKYKVLGPEGGASDVGASICHYVEHNGIDLLVLGSRGLGSFQRSVMSIIGLGSVSDYCVHNLKVPVAIIKSKEAAAAVGQAAAGKAPAHVWQATKPAATVEPASGAASASPAGVGTAGPSEEKMEKDEKMD